ncbi:protein arginine kinase [Bacillus fonticola]|uniref:protein arginine kinase n=1 Tax=Bacillus fonticola TaxID=2728853 RepID=UPI00147481BF|nr:protein arginine kinase [Bacillus fonticola]
MSLDSFLSKAVSSWMNDEGPAGDIVLTSRVRLARNLQDTPFPTVFSEEKGQIVLSRIEQLVQKTSNSHVPLEFLELEKLQPIEKNVLVEKHLISPHLVEESRKGGCLLSEDESVSIMINEEDHLRIQCLVPGLQLNVALNMANQIDDWLESHLEYAYDEQLGYLTSCPTNVGTGLRASVMMHLPALVLTQQMNRMIPSINQLGLVVRGIYGEGSEAQGNIFQISNQTTLGKSEEDIISDLTSVVQQMIAQERVAREALVQRSGIQLEDRVFRSYGVLTQARVMESKEAAQKLSDLRLGIDLGYIKHINRTILNELMILTQPYFLQQFAGKPLKPTERDFRRASLIRERLQMEKQES